jgi:hypothetical protein
MLEGLEDEVYIICRYYSYLGYIIKEGYIVSYVDTTRI